MPEFNKSKGFSLKSGNKPTFKEMGSSPLKVAGAFIDGERATYAETRKAEEEGRDVRYTNKEEAKRTKQEIEGTNRNPPRQFLTQREVVLQAEKNM